MPAKKLNPKKASPGGYRPGSGPKWHIPNPRRKTFTLPGDHYDQLCAKIQALIDQYRIKK